MVKEKMNATKTRANLRKSNNSEHFLVPIEIISSANFQLREYVDCQQSTVQDQMT